MEARDLMIMDWVLHEGEPYQIRRLGIHGVDRDGDDYPAVCVGKPNCVGLIIERNEIEPIPLTPEILEKNGFEDWDGWSIYSPENTGIEIAWLGTILKIGGECGNLELPAIEYVHQLQHTLRLCGIDKTIEL